MPVAPLIVKFNRQITDWLAHVPKEVIAKSFQADITAFDHIPSEELYIFPSGPLIPLWARFWFFLTTELFSI